VEIHVGIEALVVEQAAVDSGYPVEDVRRRWPLMGASHSIRQRSLVSLRLRTCIPCWDLRLAQSGEVPSQRRVLVAAFRLALRCLHGVGWRCCCSVSVAWAVVASASVHAGPQCYGWVSLALQQDYFLLKLLVVILISGCCALGILVHLLFGPFPLRPFASELLRLLAMAIPSLWLPSPT
jgi:hypothetical protein